MLPVFFRNLTVELPVLRMRQRILNVFCIQRILGYGHFCHRMAVLFKGQLQVSIFVYGCRGSYAVFGQQRITIAPPKEGVYHMLTCLIPRSL